MFILKILLVLICILFLLLVLILLIPFGYRIKAVSLDEKSVRFSLFWCFGLLGFAGNYVLGKGFESNISILGLKTKTNKKDGVKKKKDKKEKDKKDKKKKKRSFSVEAIEYILMNIKKTLLHIKPDKIEGYCRLGFDDPYYTGIVCAIVETLRGLSLHNLNLDYVFEDEVYEGEIYIEGSIYLVYIAYIAIRLYLNKSVRQLI